MGRQPAVVRGLLAVLALLVLAAACTDSPREETSRDAAPVERAEGAPEGGPAPPDTSEPAPATPTRPAATEDDRFTRADPEEVGLDPELGQRLTEALAERPGVREVLVARRGRLAVHYLRDAGGNGYHNVFSVTKSVLASLTGIAIGDGALRLDTRVGELLGDRIPPEASTAVADLTVEHLLTMTAGLPSDLLLPPPPAGGDWVAHALAQPLAYEPGRGFAYSSTTSHVLGAMLVEATGQDLLSFARERLFAPLGIDSDDAHTPVFDSILPDLDDYRAFEQAAFAWPTDPLGLHLGYCCLRLTGEDMLALGQLWLEDGRWQGRQVVPEDFVREATRVHVRRSEGADYGYHWWVTEEDGHRAFFAAGLGGQVVEVVPELDLVVVIASDSLLAQGSRALVGDVIVPAVR